MAVTLYTFPGIGDAYWTLAKVLPALEAGDKLDLKVMKSGYFRSGFLNYLEGVNSVSEFPMADPAFRKKCASLYDQYTELKPEMWLDANTWLEAGKRFDDYLPHLPSQYRLRWKLTKDGYKQARSFLTGKKDLVLYTSSKTNNENQSTGQWQPKYWNSVVEHLYKAIPDLNLIWIGGQPDTTILPHFNHKFRTLVDAPADTVIQLLLESRGFISYQSGLSVISVMQSIPTCMLWFPKLQAMYNTFCPPVSLDNPKLYKPIDFNVARQDPYEIVRWAIKTLS